jgi:hypothetical protein
VPAKRCEGATATVSCAAWQHMHQALDHALNRLPNDRDMPGVHVPAMAPQTAKFGTFGPGTHGKRSFYASFSTLREAPEVQSSSSVQCVGIWRSNSSAAASGVGAIPRQNVARSEVQLGIATRQVRGQSNTTNAPRDQHRLRCRTVAAQPCGVGVQGVCVTASLV